MCGGGGLNGVWVCGVGCVFCVMRCAVWVSDVGGFAGVVLVSRTDVCFDRLLEERTRVF